MRIAIASFTDGRDHEIPPGDLQLAAALSCGRQVIWSDAEVDWRGFDAVVIRSCWDYHLRVAEFRGWLDRLETSGVIVMNQPELIRWNIDKRYLRELRVPIPSTVWVEEGRSCDVGSLCGARGWHQAVIKPLISASAWRTELRSSGMVDGPAMIQEFLDEIQSDGEWSLLFFDGVFSHAVRKRPTNGDFRVQMEYGGTAEAATPSRALLDFARRVAARAPRVPTVARLDVVVTRERGPLLMELEVIEPELFFSCCPGSERRAAEAILRRVRER